MKRKKRTNDLSRYRISKKEVDTGNGIVVCDQSFLY